MRSLDVQGMFAAIAGAIHEQRDFLCELDSFAGDGDHGISMDLGWEAVKSVGAENREDLGDYLKDCAKAFIQAVGASIGPLYGTAFLRAAKYAVGKAELTPNEVLDVVNLGVQGIAERGEARLGDKSLIDTLVPFSDALLRESESPWSVRLSAALSAGRAGMESTAHMVAKVGRARTHGERSRGRVDPGAFSAYVVLEAACAYVSRRQLPESDCLS